MSLKSIQLCHLEQACEESGLRREIFLEFVHHEWIRPSPTGTEEWSDEDIARAQLIRELKEDFGVNDEAVPIILHLIDEMHAMRAGIRAVLKR